MAAVSVADTATYEGRLDVIFEIVQRAGVDGITAADVVQRVPWQTDHAEIRAKLMSLRSRDCVFYDGDRRVWFA